ncbi:HPr kinase/phosphorylase [Ahrensia sp. R2A130]|uniref:HPr kinase/phosphorylase n=1 Tax=Ahrensia sp. R2A130 TaxID=744979 RepID=UPI0001E0B4B0|nr:HPr kinase [Ahrensia sp. R2A130]EFL89741.1 HPr kinase [Ahrensia sp. R2A130]
MVDTPIHASALVLGTTGLLLRGPSGSGKSMLCHHLIATHRALNRHAVWIADDRVHLGLHHGRIIAKPVPELEGLAEFRGLGVQPVDYVDSAVIDLIIDLTGVEERVPETTSLSLVAGGPDLPLLRVPPRDLGVCAVLVAEAFHSKARTLRL